MNPKEGKAGRLQADPRTLSGDSSSARFAELEYSILTSPAS